MVEYVNVLKPLTESTADTSNGESIVDETSFRTMGGGAKLSKGGTKFRCLTAVNLRV